MAKAVFQFDNVRQLEDIIKDKDVADLRETKEEQRPSRVENLRDKTAMRLQRTMSDPVSNASEYINRARRNRCFECLYSYRFCESQYKHTHFVNSKQIAQRIYPDFLTSNPNESENPGDLRRKIKKRVLEHGYSSCVELSDNKGPSRKSLIEWYSREYGINLDHSYTDTA